MIDHWVRERATNRYYPLDHTGSILLNMGQKEYPLSGEIIGEIWHDDSGQLQKFTYPIPIRIDIFP